MIDWSRVRDLQAEIGKVDFVEVAALFLEEAEEAVERLGTDRSPAGLAAALHFLKGSALNLGFDTLARMCADGERAVLDNDDANLAAIIAAYAQSRTAFEQGIADAA